MTQPREKNLDLLVVGAGPTGIAIGAEARRAGLEVLVIDKGPLLSSLLEFPRDMVFFTTAERLEIAGIPFPMPEAKPTRRQAVVYYHGVARTYALPLALHERVTAIDSVGGLFRVTTSRAGSPRERTARAVAVATGYFDTPRSLGIEGEDFPWVSHRYDEPYRHYGDRVVVVGGGNSAAEAALELWRAGADVTLVHRRHELKPSVKYWLKPDFENRVAEGSIEALYSARVKRFADGAVEVLQNGQELTLAADAAYVLIGYDPDMGLLRDAGVTIDADSLVPAFDKETCQSDIPGLYVAGTLQAGSDTNRIFIENSRVHSRRIVEHLARRLVTERSLNS